MIVSRYHRGQRVEARDVATGTWRPAYVSEPKPYPRAKTDGAYIVWSDLTLEDYRNGASSGGWHPAKCIRELAE